MSITVELEPRCISVTENIEICYNYPKYEAGGEVEEVCKLLEQFLSGKSLAQLRAERKNSFLQKLERQGGIPGQIWVAYLFAKLGLDVVIGARLTHVDPRQRKHVIRLDLAVKLDCERRIRYSIKTVRETASLPSPGEELEVLFDLYFRVVKLLKKCNVYVRVLYLDERGHATA